MAKVTKQQLEIKEKQLELQERRALLKEAREKLQFERDYINLQKAGELRAALEAQYISDETSEKYTTLFQKKEFDYLIEKYYQILKNL